MKKEKGFNDPTRTQSHLLPNSGRKSVRLHQPSGPTSWTGLILLLGSSLQYLYFPNFSCLCANSLASSSVYPSLNLFAMSNSRFCGARISTYVIGPVWDFACTREILQQWKDKMSERPLPRRSRPSNCPVCRCARRKMRSRQKLRRSTWTGCLPDRSCVLGILAASRLCIIQKINKYSKIRQLAKVCGKVSLCCFSNSLALSRPKCTCRVHTARFTFTSYMNWEREP